MLKKFILNALSSFVGAWIAIVLFIIGLVIFILGLAGNFTMRTVGNVTKHSVLKLNLGGTIIEKESLPEIDFSVLMSGTIEKPQTLRCLTYALQEAASNENIDALYIECNGANASPATFDAIRNAVLEFKKSGKRVFAYGNSLSLGDYYVATVADVVYLNPAGSLELEGLTGTVLYFKELLDKVGIDVEIARVGKFKSAVEPYSETAMSEPARAQLDTLYTDMWGYMVDRICEARKVKSSQVDSLVNNFIALDEAEVAKKYGLVDNCIYQREVEGHIADYIGTDVEKINFVTPQLLDSKYNIPSRGGDEIAVVYACGDIAEFEGAGINCATLVPQILALADDKNVKGMVLRVNSPGGSVFGSDQIAWALDYFKASHKPLAVSMGDYAASGGYWISAGADRIYADPLTITGSIGIFGMVPNVQKLASNIGVNPQTVSTNPGVSFPSIFYPMTAEQNHALQQSIERGYEKFVGRVAKGRNKPVDYIKSIGEGRVWSGLQAKKIGLVDELGGLDDAIAWVAEKGNLDRYNVVTYPEVEENWIDMLLYSAEESNAEVNRVIRSLEAKGFDQYMLNFARWILLQKHQQARCPHLIISL
ncbi:MAG: signal peptide peptidase SppA [Muribaculaceae bacterium]|nr:signal peptide peptidase SppA [Muribaculaceae bacterium]